MLGSTLAQLGLDADEAKTYLGLLERGPQTVSQLANGLLLRRTSLYGYLKRLQQAGLVTETQRNGVKVYLSQPPEQIQRLLQERVQHLEEEQERFKRVLPGLLSHQAVTTVTPKFKLFEGVSQVQQAMRDMLLYRDITTEAFWPMRDMLDIITPEFLSAHNRERIRQNISTRAIWPMTKLVSIKQYPFIGTGAAFKREIRIAPKGIECSLGYWLYGDRALFLSSRAESFAFTIESRELAQTLRTQFEFLWQASKPIKVDPKWTEDWLRENA